MFVMFDADANLCFLKKSNMNYTVSQDHINFQVNRVTEIWDANTVELLDDNFISMYLLMRSACQICHFY